MKIFINNKEHEVQEGTSLTTLINGIENLPESGYAIAVNSDVIPASEREAYIMQPDDKVMIIRAFYGG